MTYFWSLLIGTFVLEDAAIATALALVANHKLHYGLAFAACFIGISLGDVGLYYLGYLTHVQWSPKLRRQAGRFAVVRWTYGKVARHLSSESRRSPGILSPEKARFSLALTLSIFFSRAIPGARLPTYLYAGYRQYPIGYFVALTVMSVFSWVLLAFSIGASLQSIFVENWYWLILAVLALLHVFKTIARLAANPWARRAVLHSWRRWLHFEFWPSLLFYLPIVPWYVWLSIKHREFFAPFYVNPNVAHGGLIGESKFEFLRHLPATDAHLLKFVRFEGQSLRDLSLVLKGARLAQIEFPFVVKPDVGQRGFAVRIVRSEADLAAYLKQCDFAILVQELAQGPGEAGVFYIQNPHDPRGDLFSITEKQFPVLIGDGVTTLGRLILNDKRARIIASTYFARFQDRLDDVPAQGERIALSQGGNHCQGAIFKNGQHLYSEALRSAIEKLVKDVPHFYFGRLDVRYTDDAALKRGEFQVVEINGAGSEATHIWDANERLWTAYGVLFKQWDYLFAIGADSRRKGRVGRLKLLAFLRECYRVYFRDSKLNISS